ncbi:MAG: hypothetical protein JWM87_4446 [Candidatus Eremiobacteraeota bacterium]|nr:hypothetical protein [Candidatus Eremiobacteraeota bacterium]
MRPATTPSHPPAAPQRTSATFHAMPSGDPRPAWTISIAPEYAATASAPRSVANALCPSALSAVNPTSAKAAMLYVFRSSTWNDSAAGDVTSYTSLLVAAQNSSAAVTSAAAIHHHLAPLDSGESP